MAGLVADYGSDETDSEEDSGRSQSVTQAENPLPKPKFITGCDDSIKKRSVFMNPFVEADKAEKAILEKHVKMISVDVKTVNGKKICWNYRKNKCRFGHNCKYAHDSDLQIDKSTIIPSEMKVKQVEEKDIEPAFARESIIKKKKLSGMSQDINPPKKLMKFYNEEKKKKVKD